MILNNEEVNATSLQESNSTNQSFELSSDKDSKSKVLLGDLTCDLTMHYRMSNEVMIFISSTFEDTKFEQDALILNAFPKIRETCEKLGLNLQFVSMRWGVRNNSGNDHLISELCMHLLEKCKNISSGTAYATIQSHRYGYRPFPSIIREDIFDTLLSSQILDGNEIYMKSPYWKLDESSEPRVYRLQPINSLPSLEKYLISDEDKALMKIDSDYQVNRLAEQKEAGSKWWEILEKMQNILRASANVAYEAGKFTEEQRRPFFISVTHDEVDRGIFKNDKCKSQSLYFERTITGIDEQGLGSSDPVTASTAAAYKDAEWAPWGTAPRTKILETEAMEEALKEELRSFSGLDPQNIHQFSVPWVAIDLNNPTIHPLDKRQTVEPEEWSLYLASFCDKFVSGVQRSLSSLKPRPDPLLQEVLHHRQLVQEKLRSVGFDRTPVLQAILQYLSPDCPHGDRPLVVHGSSGTGKSWIMSHAISQAKQSFPSSQVIYRLLGTSRESSNAFELLQSLSQQILVSDDSTWSNIPGDWIKLKEWFSTGKAFQDPTEPKIIFLDSLDQLSSLYGPLNYLESWLPGLKKDFPLPSDVRIVCSTLPSDQGLDLLGQLKSSISSHLNTNFLEVVPFTLDEAITNIPSMFGNLPPRGVICPIKRILTESHRSLLVELFSHHPTPLFLTVAMDLMSRWPSYATESQTVDVLRRASLEGNRGVRGLIDLLYRQLEEKHGVLLVRKVLGCMTYGLEGMGREELEDLVSLDDEVLDDVFEWWVPPVRRCPPLLVDRIIFDLDKFVVERGARGGVGVWGWYHRQFWEISQERYGSSMQRLLTNISSYFDTENPLNAISRSIKVERQINLQLLFSSASYSFDVPTSSLNTRKLSVLADSLLRGRLEDQLRLGELLTSDLSFLMGLMEAGMFQELRVLLDQLQIQLRSSPLSIPLPILLLSDLKAMSKLFSLCSSVWSTCNDMGTQLRASKQLPFQIISRMSNHTFQPQNTLLTQCKDWLYSQSPCILPVRVPLQEVDSPLDLVLNHNAPISSLCALSDHRLVSGTWQNNIRVWDLNSGECLRVLEGHTERISSVCSLPDGLLASASVDKTCRIWNLDSGECMKILESYSGVISICSLPDDQLASGSEDCTIRVWDWRSGECLGVMEGHTNGVNSLCTLSFGQLASGSMDRTVRIWDLNTGECIRMLEGHSKEVSSVCSLSGGRLASGSFDNTVRVWDLTSGQCVWVMEGHTNYITSVCMLTGFGLVTGSYDKSIRVWDLSSGECLRVLKTHSEQVTSLCSLPDGRLSSGSNDNTVQVWDLSSVEKVRVMDGHSEGITTLCPLPDHKIASGSRDWSIRVWDLGSGECVRVMEGHTEMVNCLCTLPDGRLASSSDDLTVRVWDLSSGKCDWVMKGHKFKIPSLCAVDVGRLASSSFDKTIRVWDVYTGECVWVLVGHQMPVLSIFALPDGRLASGSWDRTVRVWDLTTGECVQVLKGHTEAKDALILYPSNPAASDHNLVKDLTTSSIPLQPPTPQTLLFVQSLIVGFDGMQLYIDNMKSENSKNWISLGLENGQLSIFMVITQ